MNPDPLDLLLEKLNSGDHDAAEQVVRAYEPYLRLVVRRHLSGRLRAKFDSVDVVQSVWVSVLDGLRRAAWHFSDTAHLRAFLVTLARRRLVSRCRRHHQAVEREQPGRAALDALPAAGPRPSEEAVAEELWQRMLALCPPEQRELLQLRRQGLPMVEIAARVGMHEGSVRRILRQLARQLALAQEPVAAGG